MRYKSIFFIFILFLNFCLNANSQKMGDLYKYIIEDCYNEEVEKGYLSKEDTIYLTWCFFDSSNECFEYDIQLNNDKIQFKMPKLDKNRTSASIYKLLAPDLEGPFISIAIIPFSASYDREARYINLIRASTIVYKFRYSKKKNIYIFKSKKEYVI